MREQFQKGVDKLSRYANIVVSKDRGKTPKGKQMDKKEIIQILKDAIKSETIKFKDPEDKKYALGLLKEGDLEYFFQQTEVCEVECDAWNVLEDMRAEFDALGD